MESKYTKIQRRKIYRIAAERVFENDNSGTEMSFACHVIGDITGIDYDRVLNYFPEFKLFDPKSGWSHFWLMNEVEERVFGLLLSAEMCND